MSLVSDVQAMYLRSIQNSEARSGPIGRFKLRYNHRADIDVYSQAVDEEDVSDDYMEDSFCVANDHEDSGVTNLAFSILCLYTLCRALTRPN